MFKKMIFAALATVSMSAFAQSNTDQSTTKTDGTMSRDWSWRHDHDKDMDWSTMNIWDQRKRTEWHADQTLSGADRYVLHDLLDRSPFSVENAIIHGLSGARKQAYVINDRMLAMRFPDEMTTTSSTTVADNTAVTTITTTTTTVPSMNNWNASNIDWSNEDRTSRPMRMIMTNPIKPKDVSYLEALDIMSANLSDNESAILQDWWFNKAGEREKDVLVRLVKDDASLADQTYYPSVYMHRTYSWITAPAPF